MWAENGATSTIDGPPSPCRVVVASIMDPRFRESFAEALAKALRENEEKVEQQSKRRSGGRGFSSDDGDDDLFVRSTFEQLHFDQPTGLTARGCRLLSQALASPDLPQFALSNRLLIGLEQALNRHHVVQKSDGIHRSTEGNNGSIPATSTTAQGACTTSQDAIDSNAESTSNSTEASESLLRPLAADTEENLAASLALLAWTAHGRIPLRILCYNAPPDALLGSYHEPVTISALVPTNTQEPAAALTEPVAELDNCRQVRDEDSSPESVPHPAAAHHLNGSSAQPPLGGNYEDDEVWAAESDASDYDYGEANDLGGRSGEGLNAAMEPAPWIFPPRPEEPRSPSEVAHALVSLLSKLSFRHLAALVPWPKTVDEELSQLALALLLPRNHRHGSAILDCLEATTWQHLALHPVHVMRDAATCHPKTRLPAYLQLLHAMIQAHEIQSPSSSAPNPSPPAATSVPPATWISLSLLSSLCSTTCNDFRKQLKPFATGRDGDVIQQVHSCVVDAMDSLVDIFDVIFRSSSGVPPANDDDHRLDDAEDECLPSLFAPMFSVLALPLPPSSRQVDSFQLLLNSGLFRQLLLLWQDQHDSLVKSYTKESDVARQIVLKANLEWLESALLDLCMASPKLLGKYAWRFPGFAAAVTKADVQTESCICLEWNLAGLHLSSATATNVVRWKASSSLSTSQVEAAPSLVECQVAARSLFRRRFQLIEAIVAQWKKQRSEEDASCTDSNRSRQQFEEHELLSNFDAMLTRLVLWTLLVDALLSLERPGDVKGPGWSVHDCFLPLQRLLATFSKHRVAATNDRPKSKLEDANDLLAQERSPRAVGGSARSEPASAAPLWKQSAQDAAVDSIRRSLKTLQSLLDASLDSSATPNHTSPSHRPVAFSSKAD
jgi:hypothetical protein